MPGQLAARQLDFDVSYKTLILGESGVGKTSLINRLVKQEFKEDFISTIGIDFVKKVFLIDGVKVLLEIWDTAGQERFRSITRFQYRGTKGLFLVYDVTDSSTFDMLRYWIQSIQQDLDKDNEEPVPVFLLGNKKDLENDRHISYNKGNTEGEKNFVYGFQETSAKTGENVEESFEALARLMLEIYNPKLINPSKILTNSSVHKSSCDGDESPMSQLPSKDQTKSIKLKKSEKPIKKQCKCKTQ